jgi:hypothetical protein
MGDAEGRQFSGVPGEQEAVGGKAEGKIRVRLPEEAEGFPGLFKIRQGVAGPRYTRHVYPAETFLYRPVPFKGFPGSQYPGGYAGTAFVGTFVFTAAIIALNVAGRRYRQVDAAVFTAASVEARVAQRLEKIRVFPRRRPPGPCIPYQNNTLLFISFY